MANRPSKSPHRQILFGENVRQRNAVSILKRPLQDGLRNFEADEIVIAVGSVAVLRYLRYIETKLGADVGLRIILVGDNVPILLAKLGKFEADSLVDGGMSAIIRRIVSQRAQGKSVFVQVRSFLDQVDDEVAAAHIVREVAEILVPKGVISHVLNQRSTVGEGVGLLQIIVGSGGKSLLQRRQEAVLPRQIDDLFVGEHGIGRADPHGADLRNHDCQPEQKRLPAGIESQGHLLKTRTTKVSGTMLRRGWGLSAVAAGGGPNFAVTTNT